MKTETKNKILKLIHERGQARPHDLVQKLDITPQALHRHLKSLVEKGLIEQSGSPPHTRYVPAGMIDFSAAFAWFSAMKIETSPEAVCETRDVLMGRLSHLNSFIKLGLSSKDLPLLISIVGEIGNNSFDHNLGQWTDVPGCWLESKVSGKKLWVCIADRGQGIFESLRGVAPSILNDQTAVETAFDRNISGRSPEKRGNGLKLVKNIILQGEKRGLCCHSGEGAVSFGYLKKECEKVFTKLKTTPRGTITLIAWGFNENRT